MRDLMVGEADTDVLEAGVSRAVLGAQEAMGLERKPRAEEDRRGLTETILEWRHESIWLWKELGG